MKPGTTVRPRASTRGVPGGAAAGGHWDTAQDGDMDDYIRTIAVPQVREILSNYGPIAILWWDTPVGMNRERADMLLPLIRLQPGIIINNRVDKGRQGMQGMNKDDQEYAGDFGTPEQEILEEASEYDWESCMTMNRHWGYNRHDDDWKSTEDLIRKLADGVLEEGRDDIMWSGADDRGRPVSAGVYFCCVEAGSMVVRHKVVLVR